MHHHFIITTTNNIEGCSIEKYVESICANVVLGVNIFSDIAASFVDTWGGHCGSYQRKLELIYNEAKNELKNKAIKLGANAIVGFRVDFDEISSNKSMLMIAVSGTACVVKYPPTDKELNDVGHTAISQEDLDIELKKRWIVHSINKGEPINHSWKEFLYSHPQTEILDKLLDLYVEFCFSLYQGDIEIKTFIEKYITLLPKNDIIDTIYSRYVIDSKEMGHLIKVCHLFSPYHVLKYTKENAHLIVGILDAKKDYYHKEDLTLMQQIGSILESLPDTGNIETVKGGLLGKSQEKFICEDGHKNSKDAIFCETCHKNIKGLHKDEVDIINQFKAKLEVLSDFFLK